MTDNEPYIELDYFYGIQSEMFAFLRIPKILIKDGRFEHLSNEAKMLFGLLLDRMSLSVKNRWFDDEDRVYIIYTKDEIMVDLCVESGKCTKLLKELDEYGLIERKKQGFSKPDIIYVKNFATLVDDGQNQPKEMARRIEERRKKRKNGKSGANKQQESNSIQDVSDSENVHNLSVIRKSNHEEFENRITRDSEIEPHEIRKSNHEEFENRITRDSKIESRGVRKSHPNNTDFSNTDMNNTDVSCINPSLSHSVSPEKTDCQAEDTFYNNSTTRIDGTESSLTEGDEREKDDIYSLMEKDLACQEKIIAQNKSIRGLCVEEVINGRKSGKYDEYDFNVIREHGRYLDKLDYRLFMDSVRKYQWGQVETMEMARRVLGIRLEIKSLKALKNLDYYEDELLDTLVNYMAEIIATGGGITVNGAKLTAEFMGLKFFGLNRELILHVIQTLRASSKPVRSKKNYYISCLLNAKDHYVAEEYGDIKNG